MFDKVTCKKCNKRVPWVSKYGFCEKCHIKFLPFLTDAIRKFLKSGNRNGTGKKSWETRRKSVK